MEQTGPVIAIVGNINLDIKTSAVPASASVLSDGETSIDEIHESIGGGGANTAAAAAVMGGRPHFCFCVGDDALGQRLVGHLSSLGVLPHAATKKLPTGRSIALTWANHQRHFISSLPNNASLEPADVDLDGLARAGCRHLYRADVWFSASMLNGGNLSLLSRAQAAGMETSLDINWDPLWSSPGREAAIRDRVSALSSVLPSVSWVHGNEGELMFFTGAPTIREAARALRAQGAGAVIVHRGERGCACLREDRWIEAPAWPVRRVVSETGTGDVFTAAFLLLDELSLPERLRECCRRAALHLEGDPLYIPRLPA